MKIGFFMKNPANCIGLYSDYNIGRPGGFHTKKIMQIKAEISVY